MLSWDWYVQQQKCSCYAPDRGISGNNLSYSNRNPSYFVQRTFSRTRRHSLDRKRLGLISYVQFWDDLRKVEVVFDPKILFLVVLSDEKNKQISLLRIVLLGLKQREGEEVSPRAKRGPDKLYAQTFLDDKFALFAKQIRRTWPRRRGFDRDNLINNDEGTNKFCTWAEKKWFKDKYWILNLKFPHQQQMDFLPLSLASVTPGWDRAPLWESQIL